MRLATLFITATAAAPTTFETGNFITSPDVEWTLDKDSVMGGSSTCDIERRNDHIHFTGQLNLVGGGFAGFIAQIENKLSGVDVIRVSGRTPDPERTFEINVSRNDRDSGRWYHALPLGTDYQSFEVKLSDFYFEYHGQPNPDVPPPFGSQLRKVGINIHDKKSEAFEADINIIQGL